MRLFQTTRRPADRTRLAVEHLDERITPFGWDGGGPGWPGSGGGGGAPSPTVSINQAIDQADATSVPSVKFAVHFSSSVSGFDANDIDLSASTAAGPLTSTISGYGNDYTVTVSGMTGPGQVVASIPASVVTYNGAWNWASTSSDDSVTFFNARKGSTFFDADGDKVTVKLTGGGQIQYHLTNGRGPIERIELMGTNAAKSALSISVIKANAGTDGKIEVGTIAGSGLKSLNARSMNLTGEGIQLHGATPAQRTNLNLGSVGNGTSIALDNAIGSFTANSVEAGQIIAPSVRTMTIRGDFQADMTLSGIGVRPGKAVLGALKVTGNILGSDIQVNGNVGLIQATSFRNSSLSSSSTVSNFRITGTADAFENSNVTANRIGNVFLNNVDTDNDETSFGFTADEAIGRVTVGKPVAYMYKAGDAPLIAGDFEVKVRTVVEQHGMFNHNETAVRISRRS